ncbi:hypothetical protein [Marispirochaeta aestuarii]|uniref:hypothetical protein n=1 Tax=Marispirochaeta aestuarii TaxID=1963862 RepID=UPI002ABE2D74|nr:hypothetical protein [Marispirochaeta aestuarii]
MDIEKLKEYFQNIVYSSKNIKVHVSNEFSNFLNLINDIPELADKKNKIKNCCRELNKILREYENGHVFKSYDLFDKMMHGLNHSLNAIIVNGKKPDDFLNKDFYRMRLSSSILSNKKEIFHTPISLRRKINSQRYSVPGLPCLYLSSSVYTCWAEMNKPNIQDLHVSRYVLDDLAIVNILNFTMIDPKRLFYRDKIHEFRGDNQMYIERIEPQFLIDAIILWPLLFVCSLKGSDKSDFYKPEYIIPQFLLQWIRTNHDLKGIAYFSTDLDTKNIDPFYCINYVFPVESDASEICTYLSNIFKLTDPYRCDVIENTVSAYRGVSPVLSHRRFQDCNYRGLEIYYEHTKYGKIEQYLQLFNAEKIE